MNTVLIVIVIIVVITALLIGAKKYKCPHYGSGPSSHQQIDQFTVDQDGTRYNYRCRICGTEFQIKRR